MASSNQLDVSNNLIQHFGMVESNGLFRSIQTLKYRVYLAKGIIILKLL